MGVKRLITNPLRDLARVRPVNTASLAFHRAWPGYQPTPLRAAPHAAARLGVASVLVKDESSRLGLPSFKILGASWATYRALCRHLGVAESSTPVLADLRESLDSHPLQLVAATDGNHGRAVARMAKLLGLRAHILVPHDMVPARIATLREEGAEVTVVAGGYDDAVAASAALADDTHLVISDTSWPGYMDVPAWVIDGYGTLTQEIIEQISEQNLPAPSVVAAQIGVGAFAAAMVRAFSTEGIRVVGVEPTRADCVLAAAEAGDLVTIPDPQDSIMAGLNCGTGSPVAWPDVSAGMSCFAAVEDADAEEAMRLLAEDGIVSGESGAAGLAGLLAFSDELKLTADDHVLVVSTEGATDPVGYERIVGTCPAPQAI
ncbi:diaminopropionate ammonia-lyase [Micromonospora sp. NPDC048830]|uniref:diaminopropionate ammonia-lyase n=1 Tax=Micromonospora sp. NPDC048830 TaxID=3364257 RepID=UPI0037199DEA